MYWKKVEGEISEVNFGIHARGHKCCCQHVYFQ